MKKTKLLIGVLTASIALLGAGYASWTDQLTVAATVETGELNVKYVAIEATDTGELQEKMTEPGAPAQPGTPGSNGEEAKYDTIPTPINYMSECPSDGKAGWDPKVTGDCTRVWDGCKWWFNQKENFSEKQFKKLGYKKWNGVWYTTNKTPGCFYSDPSARCYYRLLSPAVDPVEEIPEVPAVPPTFGEDVVAPGYVNKEGVPVATIVGEGSKGIEVKFTNFYPGCFASSVFTIENDGTIPAVMDVVTATGLEDMAEVGEKKLEDQLKVAVQVGKPGTTLPDLDLSSISTLPSLKEVAATLKTACGDARLEKGERLVVRLTIIFPKDAAVGNEFEKLTGQSFNLAINWIQHNVLPTSPSPAPAPAPVPAP